VLNKLKVQNKSTIQKSQSKIVPYKRPESVAKRKVKNYLQQTKSSATKVVGVNLKDCLSNSNSTSNLDQSKSNQQSPEVSPSFGSNQTSNESKKRKKTASNAQIYKRPLRKEEEKHSSNEKKFYEKTLEGIKKEE